MIKGRMTNSVTAFQSLVSSGFGRGGWRDLLYKILECPCETVQKGIRVFSGTLTIFFSEYRVERPVTLMIVSHGNKELRNTRRCIVGLTIQRFDPHSKPGLICSVVENNTARLGGSLECECCTVRLTQHTCSGEHS